MHPRDIPRALLERSGEQVQALTFPYVRSPDQDASTPAHHQVVVVGAGPVGLTLPGGHPKCSTYGHPNCSTWPR